jgi:hypothetical protein
MQTETMLTIIGLILIILSAWCTRLYLRSNDIFDFRHPILSRIERYLGFPGIVLLWIVIVKDDNTYE